MNDNLYAVRTGDTVTGGWTQEKWNEQMDGDWMVKNEPVNETMVRELDELPL